MSSSSHANNSNRTAKEQWGEQQQQTSLLLTGDLYNNFVNSIKRSYKRALYIPSLLLAVLGPVTISTDDNDYSNLTNSFYYFIC